MESGFIDAAFLAAQLADYASGRDRDIEHYKWAAYLHSLDLLPRDDRAAFHRWMTCVDADPNPHLFKGAVRELLRRKLAPADWFEEFGESRVLRDDKTAQAIRGAVR